MFAFLYKIVPTLQSQPYHGTTTTLNHHPQSPSITTLQPPTLRLQLRPYTCERIVACVEGRKEGRINLFTRERIAFAVESVVVAAALYG